MRADQKLNYPPPPKENELVNGHNHNQNFHQQSSEKPQFRQLHLDYDLNYKENSNVSQPNPATKAEPQQATRIPTGHMRRDRASLRAKHRKDMEHAKLQVLKFLNPSIIEKITGCFF